MKNNKGFTLVELLAIILILLALSSVTTWGITSALKTRDENETKEQQKLAEGAAKIFFSLTDEKNCINLSELKSAGYFANNSKIDKLGDSYHCDKGKGTATCSSGLCP